METNNIMEAELMTRKEVKNLFRISYPTLQRLIVRGKLKAFKVGSIVRFKKADIDAALQEIK